MNPDAPRRLAVLDGDRRLDVAVPAHGTLGDALVAAGVVLDHPGVVVLRDDRPTDPTTPVHDVADGTLLTVVDPAAALGTARERRVRAAAAAGRGAAVGAWWALLAVGVVALVTVPPAAWAPAVAGALGLAAALLGVVGSRRPSRTPVPLRLAAPAVLAAAAAWALVPGGWAGGAQLQVALGAGAAALLGLGGVVLAPDARLRAALGAFAAVAGGVALLWGGTVALGWPASTAAALTAGAVPVAVRAVPAALLTIDEGYFMDYGRYLRNRWSVRGTVPQDPGPIEPAAIREQVAAAGAARVTAVVTLAVAGALALPVGVPVRPAGGLVVGGTAALLACYVLAMALLARTENVAALRWVVRASALVGAAVAVRTASAPLAGTGHAVLVGGLVAAALLAAVLAVPILRGARSLGWSRTGDVVQGIATVLVLPAALLAAGGIELVRTAVSG